MNAKKIDLILLGTIGVIIIFGILMLASISAKTSQEQFGTTYYYLEHQLLFGLLPGLILGFFAFKIDLKKLKKLAPAILIANLILMALVFVPHVGISTKGASRWISMGPLGSFQPSEFLKLTVIIYLASWLSSKKEKMLVPFLVILATIGLFLYLQPDITTLAIIAMVAVIMYFLAETPLLHTILLFLIGTGGFLIFAFRKSYQQNRITAFLNPNSDPLGIGYQIKQALIAVGSGGIFGLGVGTAGQKYGIIPESISDSIFAIIAEETGFVGCFLIVLLFMILLWRGFKVAKNSKDAFSRLLAYGITSWILLQTLINISSMTGIFPLVGIPLPFFSYGGSALIAELAAMGILLNISKTT